MHTSHKSTEDVVRTLTSTHEALLADLADFCRIPGVSESTFPPEPVKASAEWLSARLQRAGLHNVEVIAFPGAHPYVVAEWLGAHGEPVDVADVLGFVQSWRVSEAFDNVGGAGFAKAYPPEAQSPAPPDTGAWKPVTSADKHGAVASFDPGHDVLHAVKLLRDHPLQAAAAILGGENLQQHH
jgi:hypothetical protein